jgi:hypothetical protein
MVRYSEGICGLKKKWTRGPARAPHPGTEPNPNGAGVS